MKRGTIFRSGNREYVVIGTSFEKLKDDCDFYYTSFIRRLPIEDIIFYSFNDVKKLVSKIDTKYNELCLDLQTYRIFVTSKFVDKEKIGFDDKLEVRLLKLNLSKGKNCKFVSKEEFLDYKLNIAKEIKKEIISICLSRAKREFNEYNLRDSTDFVVKEVNKNGKMYEITVFHISKLKEILYVKDDNELALCFLWCKFKYLYK